jgi:CDP-glucose 4,6-dehydratase
MENMGMKTLKKFFRNKRVLITGHSGFKGSWLTQILLNFDSKITGISLPPITKPSLFKVLGIKDRVNNYFTDIRDFKKIQLIFKKEKPEIVFHLAAQPIVRESYDDPLKTFSTNVMGTANVLQAIKETRSVRSGVIITTDKVYENKNINKSYKENDALGGHDPYSSSKAAADIIIQSYIKSFFNKKSKSLIAIARAGNVIGGGDWSKNRLIPDIIRAVYETKRKIKIRFPESIRPWEHVLEPLRGYLMLAMGLYKGRKELSGAWNFGPNNESFLTVEELVSRSLHILKKGEMIIKPDASKHEDAILKLDTSKAKTALGWKPQLNIDGSLLNTLNWYSYYYKKGRHIQSFTDLQIKNYFHF